VCFPVVPLSATDADILLPMQPNRAISFVGPLGEDGIARLRPNVTIEEAGADIDRMIPILMSTFPPVRGMAQNQRLQPAVHPPPPAAAAETAPAPAVATDAPNAPATKQRPNWTTLFDTAPIRGGIFMMGKEDGKKTKSRGIA
jgi:hypothetical protein